MLKGVKGPTIRYCHTEGEGYAKNRHSKGGCVDQLISLIRMVIHFQYVNESFQFFSIGGHIFSKSHVHHR